MRLPSVLFPVVLLLSVLPTVAETNLVTTLAELHRTDGYHGREPRAFAVSGRVLSVHLPADREIPFSFVLDDGTARMMLQCAASEPAFAAGDLVTARGKAVPGWLTDLYDDIVTPEIQVVVTGHGAPPEYEPYTISQLARETRDLLYVCVTGTVTDIFHDDIDRNCIFLQLRDGNDLLSVDTSVDRPEVRDPARLLHATVRVKGMFGRNLTGSRIFLGPHVSLRKNGDLTVVAPPITDPRDAPLLEPLNTTDPRAIAARGRGALVGTVLAVRPNGKLVLRGRHYRIVNVHLSDGVVPPACGALVRVVGRPTTDLYRLNLTHALWQEEPGVPAATHASDRASLQDILPDARAAQPWRIDFHGKTVCLTGTVRSVEDGADGFRLVEVVSRGRSIRIEAPACVPIPEAGSEVEATGIWVFDVDNWRPDAILPHITGCALVLRTPADLVVLANPPWGTPFRLGIIIAALALLLVATLVWNRFMKRLIDRKGRELYRENIAHAMSELRIGERTRLAVELHDALSQTLTGVSFRIDAAEEAAVRHRFENLLNHLKTARLTLGSCREELRNCLWDLRNGMLDETDVVHVIRSTLGPHLGDAELTLRFPVPRAKLSDTAFHNVLRILRELVVNAIRHGHARHVAVAGALDATGLSFSVRDDGAGFDPSSRLGPNEGHFGIQGIEERLNRMGGRMEIHSRPGEGTKVTIQIPK